MIAASIVAGWSSTSSASLDKLGTAASAIVIARVAMAIATMFTGASLLKLSERLSSVSSAVRIIGRER